MLLKTITIALVLTASALAEKTPKPANPKPSDAPVTIQITLGDLAQARPALAKLFAFDLPVKTAWTLRKTVSVIEAELKRFEDQRNALIKKHGRMETVEGPKRASNQLIVPVENMQAFNEDFKQLSGITVDLTIVPISLGLFGEDVKLSASDMARLEPFLIP